MHAAVAPLTAPRHCSAHCNKAGVAAKKSGNGSIGLTSAMSVGSTPRSSRSCEMPSAIILLLAPESVKATCEAADRHDLRGGGTGAVGLGLQGEAYPCAFIPQ